MKKLQLMEELSRIKKMMIEQDSDELNMSDYTSELPNEKDGKTYPFLVDDEVTYTISTAIDLLNNIMDSADMDEKQRRDLLVLIEHLLHDASNEVSHEMSTDEVIEIWNNITNN